MKRFFASALLFALLGAPALAQTAPTSPTQYCSITTSTATVCRTATSLNSYSGFAAVPMYLVGVVNNSLSAQTATVTCYDSASGTSGPVVASIGPLGISQVISFPSGGRAFVNGLICQASAVPNGAGIEIYSK